MSRVSVIIIAAGEGRRFGSPKQMALLKGKPVLEWCLEKFEAHREITEIVLALRDEEQKERYLENYSKITAVTRGGERRQDSVLSGFRCLDSMDADVVLIHDGVRPLVSEDLIDRIIAATRNKGAAIPVISVDDTVKVIENERVLHTVDREKLYRVQTPQGFFYDILKTALDKAKVENYYGSDEASLVERTGKEIMAVPGDRKNIKITTPEDILLVEAFLED